MRFNLIFSILLCLSVKLEAQTGNTTIELSKLNTQERKEVLYRLSLELTDSASFFSVYPKLLHDLEALKDKHGAWMLAFEYTRRWRERGITEQTAILETEKLRDKAAASGYLVEELVANHYLNFGRYHSGLIPHEQLYAHILHELDRLEEIGIHHFRYYQPARILYHAAKFLYETEDYSKVIEILQKAEPHLDAQSQGLQTWVLVMNLIESSYKEQKNYTQGINYAKKILAMAQHCPHQTERQMQLCRAWQGLASIDIANMLVELGDYAVAESFSNSGYKIIKELGDEQSEFDALLVLIHTKLKLNKLTDAGQLLNRTESILNTVGKYDYYYTKKLKYYQLRARYAEKVGDFSLALQYYHLGESISDSIAYRNDIRKLEQVQQRVAAEKYTAKLALLERDRATHKIMRNAAGIILILLTGITFFIAKQQQQKKNQALADLESANLQLETYTQHIREKIEITDKLKAELEELSRSGERSEYLEKLSESTILTDEDWKRFRVIFEKVHPNFIESQMALYPDLTQAEMRYLVLEKLHLTTNEMANMLGVSTSSIRQTRLRMRRKTGG